MERFGKITKDRERLDGLWLVPGPKFQELSNFHDFSNFLLKKFLFLKIFLEKTQFTQKFENFLSNFKRAFKKERTFVLSLLLGLGVALASALSLNLNVVRDRLAFLNGGSQEGANLLNLEVHRLGQVASGLRLVAKQLNNLRDQRSVFDSCPGRLRRPLRVSVVDLFEGSTCESADFVGQVLGVHDGGEEFSASHGVSFLRKSATASVATQVFWKGELLFSHFLYILYRNFQKISKFRSF